MRRPRPWRRAHRARVRLPCRRSAAAESSARPPLRSAPGVPPARASAPRRGRNPKRRSARPRRSEPRPPRSPALHARRLAAAPFSPPFRYASALWREAPAKPGRTACPKQRGECTVVGPGQAVAWSLPEAAERMQLRAWANRCIHDVGVTRNAHVRDRQRGLHAACQRRVIVERTARRVERADVGKVDFFQR